MNILTRENPKKMTSNKEKMEAPMMRPIVPPIVAEDEQNVESKDILPISMVLLGLLTEKIEKSLLIVHLQWKVQCLEIEL